MTMLYRLRRFTPRHAARDILRAVERDAAIAPITVEATTGLLASRLTPDLLHAWPAPISSRDNAPTRKGDADVAPSQRPGAPDRG